MNKSTLLITLLFSLALISCVNATSTVIFDDQTSYWTAGGSTTVTDDYADYSNGSMSVQAIISGGTGAFYKSLATQNWTTYDTFNFYWLGAGSNHTIRLVLMNGAWAKSLTWWFSDSVVGWQKFTLRLDQGSTSTSMNLDEVAVIAFYDLGDGHTFHVDYVTIENDVPEVEKDTMIYLIYTFGMLAVLGICLLLFKFNVPIVGFIFGIIALGLVAATIGSQYVYFSPYLQLGTALVAVVLMLASAQRGVKT